MTPTLLDSPLIAKLALEWLRAEHAAQVAETGENFIPSDDEIAIAQDRVYQVCMGEVRWSECGPGDKAIWKGRMRDVARFEQMWRTSRRVDKHIEESAGSDGIHRRRFYQRRHAVWYDTMAFLATGNAVSTRLFGNTNIGDHFLTNLQVPWTLAPREQTSTILSFSVSVSSMTALRWAADHVMFTFIMGCMPQSPGPLFVRDLFMGVPLLRPIVVPPRQTMSVQVDVRGLAQGALPGALPDGIDPFTLTFHIEGLTKWEIQ